MSNRVKNKVGLITGAAQGLGKEMARLLIEEGAQIVMTDINEELLKIDRGVTSAIEDRPQTLFAALEDKQQKKDFNKLF